MTSSLRKTLDAKNKSRMIQDSPKLRSRWWKEGFIILLSFIAGYVACYIITAMGY